MRFRLFFNLAVLLLAFLAGGCTFARVVTNGSVRDLRTDWIVPGRTTRAEVLARLGPPAAVSDRGHTMTDRMCRYVRTDTRLAKLEAGFIVTPTFERTRTRLTEDILIEFDEKGIVTRISRVIDQGGHPRVIQYDEARP